MTEKEDTEKCTPGGTSPGRRCLVCNLYSSVYAGFFLNCRWVLQYLGLDLHSSGRCGLEPGPRSVLVQVNITLLTHWLRGLVLTSTECESVVQFSVQPSARAAHHESVTPALKKPWRYYKMFISESQFPSPPGSFLQLKQQIINISCATCTHQEVLKESSGSVQARSPQPEARRNEAVQLLQ